MNKYGVISSATTNTPDGAPADLCDDPVVVESDGDEKLELTKQSALQKTAEEHCGADNSQ